MRLSKYVAAATVFAALALFVMACSSQSGSPVSPSGAAASSLSLEAGGGSCTDGKDNDGNKLIDCADPGCATDPACTKTPPGTPCSPGYWKTHETQFADTCVQVPAPWTCGSLLTALTCKGSDASCRRSEAAAALNAINGCTE